MILPKITGVLHYCSDTQQAKKIDCSYMEPDPNSALVMFPDSRHGFEDRTASGFGISLRVPPPCSSDINSDGKNILFHMDCFWSLFKIIVYEFYDLHVKYLRDLYDSFPTPVITENFLQHSL